MEIDLVIESTEEEISIESRWDDADILIMPENIYSLGACQSEFFGDENPLVDAGFSESGSTDIADVGVLSITATLAKLGWQLSQRHDGKYFLYSPSEDDDEPIDGVSVIAHQDKSYNITPAFESPTAAYEFLKNNLDLDDDEVYILDKAVIFAKDGRDGLTLECDPEDADKTFELPDDMASSFKEHYAQVKRDFIVKKLTSEEFGFGWVFIDGILMPGQDGNVITFEDALKAEEHAFLNEKDCQEIYSIAYQSVEKFITATVKDYEAWARGEVYEVGVEYFNRDSEEFTIEESAIIYGWNTDEERNAFADGIIKAFVTDHKFVLVQKDNPALVAGMDALNISAIDMLRNIHQNVVALASGDFVACLDSDEQMSKLIHDFDLPSQMPAQYLLGADYIVACAKKNDIKVSRSEYTEHYVNKFKKNAAEREVINNNLPNSEIDVSVNLTM